MFFQWPNKVWSGSPSPCGSNSTGGAHVSDADQNLRSVSQMDGAASVASANSHVYVKMTAPTAGGRGPAAAAVSRDESDYISVLYSAVQRQGGRGSVETAISPYLRLMKSENEKCQRRLSDLMNVKQVSADRRDLINTAF